MPILCECDSCGKQRQTIPGAFSYRGPALEWFPDRKHLLVYGHGVVGSEQGSLVQSFPESFRGARHVFPDGRLLNANTSGRDAALVSLKLSDSALAQAQAAIDAGGRAEDAGLPPLTAADLSGLENIALAESGGAWRVTADPAPAPPEKLLQKPLYVRLQDGESLDQELDASMWQNAAGYVLSISPPAYVFPEGAADGLGTTVLTPDTADSNRAAR